MDKTMSHLNYQRLGRQFIAILREDFQACSATNLRPHEYQRIDLAEGFNFRFQKWGTNRNKPYYIILYTGDRYLFELDLSRIVKVAGQYTWYLNRPTNKINQRLLGKLLEWVDAVPAPYIAEVRRAKSGQSHNSSISASGYRLCQGATRNYLLEKFALTIQSILSEHRKRRAPRINPSATYDLNDSRAVEGYGQDRRVTTYSRNRPLIEECKKRDEYKCQVCKFRLDINGQFVIECHHTNPLSQTGRRLTSIDDLVCLCPTCHRIAHQRQKPYSVDEIKKIRGIR